MPKEFSEKQVMRLVERKLRQIEGEKNRQREIQHKEEDDFFTKILKAVFVGAIVVGLIVLCLSVFIVGMFLQAAFGRPDRPDQTTEMWGNMIYFVVPFVFAGIVTISLLCQ